MPFGKKGNIASGKKDNRKNKGGNPKLTKGHNAVGVETRFTKGNQPKNKKLSTILKERGLTRTEINERFADIISSTPKQLSEIKIDEETTMLELIGIAVTETSLRNSDTARLDWLLDKVFGKMPEVTRTENLNLNANVESQVTETDRERFNRVIEERARKLSGDAKKVDR